MSTIIRFVTPATPPATGYNVTLDLNSDTGFQLLQGLDLGLEPIEKVWLSQESVDGATLASTRKDIATMRIPIRMTSQGSWAAMQNLMTALATQLDKKTNLIEYRPHGAPASIYIKTYRASAPSLFRGEDAPAPSYLLQDPRPMELLIDRDPLPVGSFI